MKLEPFKISEHNEHYEGVYEPRMMEWRRLGAVDKVRNIQALLGKRAVSSILEVGCGTGDLLVELARRGIGSSHVGIDLADPTHHATNISGEIELLSYDGVTLPFPDGHFDLVIASHVVEHVPNPRGFIGELARVSRDVVYIEVPCDAHVRASSRLVQLGLDIGHINAYTPEYFLVLLQTSEVEVLEFEWFDHSFDVHKFGKSTVTAYAHMALRRGLLALNPVLASRLFCYHCAALVRRHTLSA